jgi:hypothetical protein
LILHIVDPLIEFILSRELAVPTTISVVKNRLPSCIYGIGKAKTIEAFDLMYCKISPLPNLRKVIPLEETT